MIATMETRSLALVLVLAAFGCASAQGPDRRQDADLYRSVLEKEVPTFGACDQLFVVNEALPVQNWRPGGELDVGNFLAGTLPTSSQQARQDFEARNSELPPIPSELTATNLGRLGARGEGCSFGGADGGCDSGNLCGEVHFTAIGYGEGGQTAILCTQASFGPMNATDWCSLWERTAEGDWNSIAKTVTGGA